MNIRHVLALLLVLALAPAAAAQEPKPNIIVILADDMDYNSRIKHVGVEKNTEILTFLEF